MKQFFITNWYKLMIGTSAFIFALGFFINSITPAIARNSSELNKTNFSNKITGKDAPDNYGVVVSGGYAFLIGYNPSFNGTITVYNKTQLK